MASEDESEKDEIESSSRKRLGYYYLKLGEEHRGQESIQLPAGQIELSIAAIYGRPSQSVLQAIDEPAESSTGKLWLRAVVARDSKWLGRVLGESMTDEFSRGFAKEVDLSAEDTQTITIGTEQSDKAS